MKSFTVIAVLGFFAALSTAQRYDGQFWPCNPTKNATGACPPSPGLPNSTYFIDFTKVTSIPPEWTLSNWASLKFGPLGAEFTFNKRYDAPQLWTNFMMLFGKVTIEARVANGTAMISSAVLMSDTFDEIDYEFSGNNFGQAKWAAGQGQNNYFGKGVTGNYDRGSYFPVSNPQKTFHKYTIDWSPTALSWLVDGQNVRTHLASQSTPTGAYQYPQTPSKFQLGIWCAGDPQSNTGTRDWAGGYTDLNGGPYTMYIKSVLIENMNPAYGYNYTDQTGSYKSIEVLTKPFKDGIAQPNGPDAPEDNADDPDVDDDAGDDGDVDDSEEDDGDDDTPVPIVPATLSSTPAPSSTTAPSTVAPSTVKTLTTSNTPVVINPIPKTTAAPSTTSKPTTAITPTAAYTSSKIVTSAKPTTPSSTLKTTINTTAKTTPKSSSTCTTTKKLTSTTTSKSTTTTAAAKRKVRWTWWWGKWYWTVDGKKWYLYKKPAAKSY